MLTLGTLMHMEELRSQAEAQLDRFEFIVAKLRELNFRYCWTPELRDKQKTNWEQINRHLWRIQALYHGGDCFLASWPGAVPHQRLYPSKGFSAIKGTEDIPPYRQPR